MKLNALGYNGLMPSTVSATISVGRSGNIRCYEHNQVSRTAIDNSSDTSREPPRKSIQHAVPITKAASSKDPTWPPWWTYMARVTIKHNLIIEPEADLPFDPARNHVITLARARNEACWAENNLVFGTLEQSGLVMLRVLRLPRPVLPRTSPLAASVTSPRTTTS